MEQLLVIRDKLVVNGLDIDGIHVTFMYHAKKNDLTRVLVSKLPLGISNDEICYALGYYGDILSVQQVTRVMFGEKLDTGNRVVIFKKIYKDIHPLLCYCKRVESLYNVHRTA